MGFGDPDHHHPLTFVYLEKNDIYCFRCDLAIEYESDCFGCDCCSHYVHILCFHLSENMIHPLHPEHSLTRSPSPSSKITSNCNQCHEPFHGGYTYSCQECLKFDLHLKCFLTLNLETKHHHPLRLCKAKSDYFSHEDGHFKTIDCAICGLLIDKLEIYSFSCKDCKFFIHLDCTFLPPTVKHHHVHELTFCYNYPEESDLAYCDVCEDRDGKELDRTLSYYYCRACDYIAHVRCVTFKPAKVTTQFDHFIHEHPMIYMRNPIYELPVKCNACPRHDRYGGGDEFSASFYFCLICKYKLHKSCIQFPRFIKHPCHKENHTLCLQSHASEDNKDDCQLICCDFCNKKLERRGWFLRCSDCDCAVHLSCACDFKHPLYKDTIFTFSSNQEIKFRCNACGELGDGFRMSSRQYVPDPKCYDIHKECFALPGQIKHACHLHYLYLVIYLTEIETYISTTSFQCEICHTEADPHLWVYCCIQCRYIAHLTCVVNDLLPGGQSCELSNFFPIAMHEEENFLAIAKRVHCSTWLSYTPALLPCGFFHDPQPPLGDHSGQLITSDVVHCPKCDVPISVQAYSCEYDWIHRNLKASIYNIQIESPADHESFNLLDEKIAEELTCPICNLLIFPPTYSCADCQIFFHKSCAELPRAYTVDHGHTLLLQSQPLESGSLTNCSKCECPFKGYAYFCEIGFDVTCALGAPLLKLENQNHSFASNSIQATNFIRPLYRLTHPPLNRCGACGNLVNGKSIHFACEAPICRINLHFKCAMLPSMVKVERRIHHHPLVLEPSLDLSVDDYICDVCEKALNPCIWVYRCSDSCRDRATFHVSCIITSNKKNCHFIYDQECSYPHVENPDQYDYLKKSLMEIRELAGELVKTPPERQYGFLYSSLCRFVRELEHEYAHLVTEELMEMDHAEVLHLMESPDALKAKVAETMKRLIDEGVRKGW